MNNQINLRNLMLYTYDYQQEDTYLTNSFNDIYTAYYLLGSDNKQIIILLQQAIEKILKEVFTYLDTNYDLPRLVQYLYGETISKRQIGRISNSHNLKEILSFFTNFQILDGISESAITNTYITDLSNGYLTFRYPNTKLSSSILYTPDALVLLFERCLALYKCIYTNYFYIQDCKFIRNFLDKYNSVLTTLNLKNKSIRSVRSLCKYEEINLPSLSQSAINYINSIEDDINYIHENVYEIKRFDNIFVKSPVELYQTINISKFRKGDL